MLFKLYFISVSRSYLVFNNKAHDPGKKINQQNDYA